MNGTNRMMMTAMAGFLAATIAIEPLASQGKGKGPEKKEEQRADRRPEPSRSSGRSNDRAQPRSERGSDLRKETRPDQRIQRQIEHEFAGDVGLRGQAPGNAVRKGRFARDVIVSDLRPTLRRFVETDRAPGRAAAGAVSRAHLRGVDDDELVIATVDDRVRVLNRAGLVLVELDEERARNLGRWEVIPIDGEFREGTPAFCRSGEGHPVFGRQWCIDKRFGLGERNDFRWGRTDRITDVRFLHPVTTGALPREALLSMIGPIAFDRLALHAITLGLSDPLTGRWMQSQEPGSPRVLLVSSGKLPVAEIVDIDKDNRADMIVVALRGW